MQDGLTIANTGTGVGRTLVQDGFTIANTFVKPCYHVCQYAVFQYTGECASQYTRTHKLAHILAHIGGWPHDQPCSPERAGGLAKVVASCDETSLRRVYSIFCQTAVGRIRVKAMLHC